MSKKFLIVLVGILLSCSREDTTVETQEFVAGEISVGIKSGTDINAIFNFINEFEHKANRISGLTFTSDLPADSLGYVLDYLNKKTYTNHKTNSLVTGYIHYETNKITLFPKLFEMDKIAYQNNWHLAMKELKLSHTHHIELNSGIIDFYVPIGSEITWKNEFKKHKVVQWATLNYLADIELHKD